MLKMIFLPCIHICIAVKVFSPEKKEFRLIDSLLPECLAVVHPID